jgi:hypothetical protein
MPLDFFHWDCVKGQACNQKVNILDEPKAWIAAAVTDLIKDMFQSI